MKGRWLRLDATIHSDFAKAKGRTYAREFDGEHDIPTVEGPIVKELGSYADYPEEVARWYEEMAREVMRAVEARERREAVAADDRLWGGPESERVRARSVR